MPKRDKHITGRISTDNWIMVQDLADVFFRDSDQSRGNFNDALNYIITSFRNDKEFGKLLSLLRCKAEFDRGVRTRPVIEGNKQLDKLLARMGISARQ